MTRNITALHQRIQHLTERYPFAVHWQVRDIATGQTIGHEDRTVLGSFSTRKVSVLLACLALVRAGKLSLDDTFVITEELKDGVQAGIMRNLSPGIALSLRDHLAQMMSTSDNMCTQLVYEAIEQATGNDLQWINDYCAQAGMFDTLHREVFPRSGQLPWHHSIESMTVTSAHDQALLLERLAHGVGNEDVAVGMGLTPDLCQLAIEFMSHIYTPLLGARVDNGRFVEKNGRGIRGLSQVGLLLDDDDVPVASVAVFAESIPVALFDDVPGRARAIELFVNFGQLIEEHFLDGTLAPMAERHIIQPDFWEQEFGELLYTAENSRAVNADMAFTFSGVGKVFFAVILAELAAEHHDLLDGALDITLEHRQRAETGTLRHLTGPLRLSVNDAIQLIIGSGDGAAALAVLEYLHGRKIDVLSRAQSCFADLNNTEITGLEEDTSAGEAFIGTTTAADLLLVLRKIIDDDGLVKAWMSNVFEPGGLACALPGYGPHTIDHWTVSSWAHMIRYRPEHGRTSVLILNGSNGHYGIVAHAPVGTEDVSAKFGSLGQSSVPCSKTAVRQDIEQRNANGSITV